jgi:pyruvate dehydrogenase E1 component alpha subunit
MRKTDQVAVCFFGDGASNRGTVHEAMNMASIWKLPVIFVVENNQYASTTPQSYACSVSDISIRATAYNMPGTSVDGNNLLKVREVTLEAVQRARKGEGPSLIENKTYRFRGHYEGDPQAYRAEAEIAAWKNNNDPVKRFADYLSRKSILTPKLNEQIWDEVEAELRDAVTFADESPLPDPQEALEDLFVNR